MANLVYDKFRNKLVELAHIQTVLAVLDWDMSVNMPAKAAEMRGHTVSYYVGLLHEKFLAKDFVQMLVQLKKQADSGKLSEKQKAVVLETYKEYEKEKKLPAEFVQKLSQATTEAHHAWINARKKSDFKLFAPHLEKIVRLKRQQAKFWGFKQSPYDPLLDICEPNLTSEDCSIIFDELKKFLIPFLQKIKKSKVKIDPKMITGDFPRDKQEAFNNFVISKLGFDLTAGRVDVSAHPFATGFSPNDVRITTRYKQDNLLDSLTGVMHESGHGMYEQGLDAAQFGTPLGSAMWLGIHESQSRLWENLVGRSKFAWKYFYPKLQKEFPKPFGKVKLEEFYRVLNQVHPSLIRVEADEVTYNLHIIIRFEIEKELIEGTIEVADLPQIWNQKYENYLGVKVPSDALGVLQDVHWSAGLIGYFPSYTLGNLYSAQLFAAALKKIPNLAKRFEKGDFSALKKWLNTSIHRYGRLYSTERLVRQATGEPLNIGYYTSYLKAKYSEIYKLT